MAAFATLVCQRNCVFLCKGTKLKNSACAEFSDCLPVSSFASENSCFRNSHEQKLQNSAKPNSGTVRRFSPLIPAVWGFGLGLLGGQGFIGAKASHPDQRFGTETALPCANALCQNCKKLCFLRLYAGVLWRDLVLAFGKARQTLLFAK